MRSMSSTLIDYAAITPTPWKNGRGVTRILCDDSDGDPASPWSWRISIAEITGTQPYSPYPGVHRGQVALGPGDVRLNLNGRPTLLRVEQVIEFEGEDEVSATPLAAGFLDLNVMTRRDAWRSDVEIFRGTELGVDADGIAVLVALDDRCTIDGHPRRRLDAARLVGGSSSALSGHWALARLAAA